MRSIRNCNVGVIGGAGFLGSHLVNHLIEDRGCSVLVVDNLCSGRKEFIHPKAQFVNYDITESEDFLRQLFKMHKIQYVFNYAALPYVPLSYVRPLHVFNINTIGAIKVINAAQEAGCEGILQISSAEIYPNQKGKISEDAPVAAHSTYGASKLAVDYYCQCAWRERETPVIALRQFNAYGPNATHDYVIPTIISQIQHGGPSIKLGNNSIRDFQYAEDAVKCAVELLEKGRWGQVYNMGAEESISIYDLAQRIGEVMGCGRVTILQDPKRVRPWEIWSLMSDNSKLQSTIDYRHQTLLREGLEKTLLSYLNRGGKWAFE